MLDTIRQSVLDEEHLRLLRICYFIMGGTAAFGLLFGGLYLAMGLVFAASFSSMPNATGPNAPPAFVGWIFAAVGGFIVILAGGFAVLSLLTARALGRRQSRTLCLVTAGLSCLQIPFGTALGIFTFIVLGRPSVQALFLDPHGAAPPAGTFGPPPPPPSGAAA